MLLAVAIVTAPLLIVAVWADQQITDTDRYVDAVSGLSDDPRVQQYVASELAKAFSEHVDVDAELKKVLPQELQSFSQTLATGLDGFVEAAASRFTASSAFHTIWVDANRAAHRILVAVLTGERDAVTLSDGRLTVDLGDALRELQTRLVDDGLTIAGQVDLSGVDRQIVLADGASVEAIEDARGLLGNLQDLVWALAALTILAAAASVLVAPRRGRAVVRLGVGLAVGVVVAAIGVSVTRDAFVDDVGNVPAPVVGALFDALADSLRVGLRFVFVIGVAAAILAVIVMHPAYATRWSRPAQLGVLAVGLIALLVRDDLTTSYVLAVALATVVAIILLEVLRRNPAAGADAAERHPDPTCRDDTRFADSSTRRQPSTSATSTKLDSGSSTSAITSPVESEVADCSGCPVVRVLCAPGFALHWVRCSSGVRPARLRAGLVRGAG